MLPFLFTKKTINNNTPSANSFRRNKVMKDLMERPAFQKALKTTREQREFFKHIQAYKDKGIKKADLKEILVKLKLDHDDHILTKDIKAISKDVISRRTGKYIKSTPASKSVEKPKRKGILW